MDLQKLPISYGVDFFCMHNDCPVWIEFKRRSHPFGRYPDVMLSALKWWKAVSLARETMGTFIFAVGFDDLVGITSWNSDNQWVPEIRYGGRTKNTRDQADVEPVVHISIDRFGLIK